ncbi:hypothetical protein [Prevotella sp. KH2C16]|uniref:hypothetical protein n=1 Tax=Prevotella sp. KH2C16 TaxID=1855325 RepID=UPI0008E48F78|nr:hypothetical protein [Prevotella sp. KH2C16]SFF99879.1 hypothetical protein SAMN05216383_103174 [Prevotella sp. KH2C16]
MARYLLKCVATLLIVFAFMFGTIFSFDSPALWQNIVCLAGNFILWGGSLYLLWRK